MVTSPSYPAEAPNGAGLNLVTLLKPKGESNGEHKASLTIVGVLSTRRRAIRFCPSQTCPPGLE